MFVSLLGRYGAHVVLGVSLFLLAAGVVVNTAARSTVAPIAFTSEADLPDGSPIQVHVTGAVREPGVFTLQQGDRIVHAIAAAGGLAEAADASSLNQARLLRDGEQIVVPAVLGLVSVSQQGAGGLTDLNTASAADLDRLPGIGEAYARRIIDSRTADGPFASVEDLAARRILPASTLESIRPHITVSR